MFQPRSVRVSLPVIVPLDRTAGPKLRDELAKDSGFRLDLPVQESAKAFALLQQALKSQKVGLVLDQSAQVCLKNKQLKAKFVLYLEDVTPEELEKVFRRVVAENDKAEARKKGDGQFQAVVLTRLSKEDFKELADLIKTDLPKLPGKPEARPEHRGLVLACNPLRPRPGSAEVKQFLEGRKPARPGTLQVLLVLDETKG
jgi:hypothetical protein